MTVFLIVVAKVPNEIKDDFDEMTNKKDHNEIINYRLKY